MRNSMNRHEKQNTNARSHVFVSPAKRKQDWLPSGLVWIVFVVSATRLFGWISRYAVNMFFSDQWDFNDATLFEKHSLWEMFRWQHGPHRQGMGALISYFVEPHFRWNSRTESFCIGGLIVIAAACAMWLKKRITGTLTYFDVCIPLIFFTPLQFGQIFVVANWAHGPPAAIPDHSLLPGLDDSARVMALWFGSNDQLRDDLHGVRIVYRDDHSAGARRGLSRKHQEDVSGTALVPGFVAAFARIVRLVFRALRLYASRGLR